MRRSFYRPTWVDAMVVLGLVSAPVWQLTTAHRRGGATTVEVYRDNRLLGAYPLNRDRSIPIGDSRHPEMLVEISNKRVRVAHSDCPKLVCMHSGWQQGPGRSIVCLPNRVMVQLKGGRAEYDAESY